MLRRSMIKGIFASLLSMLAINGTEVKAKGIQEERTREYLDKIPLWDERAVFGNEENMYKEFLYTANCDRKEMLDSIAEEMGFALIYSPRWIIQKGHFFDILCVKIGEKNVAGLVEVFKRTGEPFVRLREPFNEKLSDCINV